MCGACGGEGFEEADGAFEIMFGQDSEGAAGFLFHCFIQASEFAQASGQRGNRKIRPNVLLGD
jgi:hypothetical protein